MTAATRWAASRAPPSAPCRPLAGLTCLLRRPAHHPAPPRLQVVAAQRGSEALQLLADRVAATGSPGVDLILKDHDPPATNSVRFLHRLKERQELSKTPCIGECGAPPVCQRRALTHYAGPAPQSPDGKGWCPGEAIAETIARCQIRECVSRGCAAPFPVQQTWTTACAQPSALGGSTSARPPPANPRPRARRTPARRAACSRVQPGQPRCGAQVPVQRRSRLLGAPHPPQRDPHALDTRVARQPGACAGRQHQLGGHTLCRSVPPLLLACPGRPLPCLPATPTFSNSHLPACLPACSPPASCPPLMTPTAATAPTPQREPRLPRACRLPGARASLLSPLPLAGHALLSALQPSDPCACIAALLPSCVSACLQGVGGC